MFHSREIGRRVNDFEIFKDDKLYEHFLIDLEKFLQYSRFKMFFIVVDKGNARISGWNDVKIYQDTTLFLVRNFLLILLTGDSKGEVIIESASAEKDIYLLNAFNYFLSAGLPQLGVDYKTVRSLLTSVSFVTKNNHDIEEQIADLFAYAAKIKYFRKKVRNRYDIKMLELLEKKIFYTPPNINRPKNKFYKEVNIFFCRRSCF